MRCDRVFCGVVGDAIGFNTFSFEQSDPRIPLKKSTFSMGRVDQIAPSTKLGSKRHFFDCVVKCPMWSPIGNRPFRSTDPTAEELAYACKNRKSGAYLDSLLALGHRVTLGRRRPAGSHPLEGEQKRRAAEMSQGYTGVLVVDTYW